MRIPFYVLDPAVLALSDWFLNPWFNKFTRGLGLMSND